MKHLTFAAKSSRIYKYAILIKQTSLNEDGIKRYYIDPLIDLGIQPEDVIAVSLYYGSNKKVTAKQAQEYIEQLVPFLNGMQVEYLLIADSTYFSHFTKEKKPDSTIGMIYPAKVKDIGHMHCTYLLNHSALLYNPAQGEKIQRALEAVANHNTGNYQETRLPFTDERYPQTVTEIEDELTYLLTKPALTIDIEAFSLRLGKAGIGTIAFGDSPTSGSAFLCDFRPCTPADGMFGYRHDNKPVRKLLRSFLEAYKGRLIAHNAAYDFKQMIFELFMDHPLDKQGMLKGLHIMCRLYDDTKIMAYCAYNSTSQVSLGLKQLTQAYAGNYGEEDIKDIRRIEPFQLLRYNLTDSCATFWLWEKLIPILENDHQVEVYQDLMLPSQKVLIQTELHGMPMYPERIQEVKKILQAKEDAEMDIIQNSPFVDHVTNLIQIKAMNDANAKLKTKQHTIDKFADIVFNPNSGKQKIRLLFEVMGFPIISYTESKMPSTDDDTLNALVHYCKTDEELELINALIAYSKVSKVLSTFIPAFEGGFLKADGYMYLHGNFNVGGTKSGRLSSSDPNLQNLPAGSVYGKLVKYIFGCFDGRTMGGADFNSLEDYISALLSKDPNKLKIYLDGYDSHSYRAFAYWPERCPGIVNTVKSINSIKELFEDVRQASKEPTFLLTYGGTKFGLMKNCNMPEEDAERVENAYHELYKVSDAYVARRIQQASRDGYATLAFGFRIRTPLLKNTVVGSRQAIREASSESRTVGNAFGQSYGLLTNRAAVEFMQRVWDSPYCYDIMPIALIHDAIYLVWTDTLEITKFVNDNLIDCMEWQELPEIAHDKVKLGAKLEVFYQSWDSSIQLGNYISEAEILETCIKGKAKYDEKKGQ